MGITCTLYGYHWPTSHGYHMHNIWVLMYHMHTIWISVLTDISIVRVKWQFSDKIWSTFVTVLCILKLQTEPPVWHLNLFFSRYVWPRFLNLRVCEQINYLWKWGLVSGLSSKTGAWELIIHQISRLFDENRGQIGASGAKNCPIFWKLLILEANFYIYLSNEGLVNKLKPQLGVLWMAGEA